MDIDIEKLVKTFTENLDLSNFKGDIVAVKNVENEFGTIEAGGIGVQKVYHTDDGKKAEGKESVEPDSKPKAKRAKAAARPKERELMTFKKKGIVDGHVSVLFNKLYKEGWIEGTERDFKALFSGRRQDFTLVWTGKYGKSTLSFLFAKMEEAKTMIVPDGFTIASILEGHFLDKDGHFLTGLGHGDAPNDKALPVVVECIKLLQLRSDADVDYVAEEIRGMFSDYSGTYDNVDQQDMHWHRK